jgi:hypothetical protein
MTSWSLARSDLQGSEGLATHRLLPAFACAAAVLGLTETASAQFGICKPVAERARPSDVGCWIVAHGSVGQLSQPQVYWHLDAYPTQAAAEAVKGPRGTAGL